MRNIVAYGLALLAFAAQGTGSAQAAPLIVEKGQARAEIVIASNATRTVRLAASELQDYIRKISGATLPVTHEPGGALPVQVYIGRSVHTDKLGIRPYDIKDGGYRMVSSDTWLALLGRDDDFTPIEPWPHGRADWTSGRVLTEWDQLTGDAKWGNPMGGIYKNKAYFQVAPCAAAPTNEPRDRTGAVQLWAFDERGSFNAACDFLRRLGVRWYMPGELGEVVPRLDTIPLPRLDETVRPAFPVRQFCLRFNGPQEETMWAMRLGLRDAYGLMIAHGLALMTDRPEFQAAHPDYFALYGGKRDNHPDIEHKRQLCLSSEALFKETVAWARTVFDHYQYDAVSIWPPDGFSAICQCPLCEGKDSPERPHSGRLSDYVWDYVDRVAKEVAKTHPDRRILGGAYGIYTLPPLKIDKLSSNVVVCIVGGRRPTANKPEQQEEFRQLRESWLPKTANPILIFENYPFTGRGWTLPSFVPQTMGASINATKPYSMGEDIWFSAGLALHTPAYNHFNLYFTARMYWDNDVDKLYREYCRLFYGPAEVEMKAFFDYCEAHWQDMEGDAGKAARALELFAAAGKKANPESVYGKRIALMADYLKGFKARSEQLAQPRDDSREQRVHDNAAGIAVDGRLDDAFWKGLPPEAIGRLALLETSNAPAHATEFKAGWAGDNLYFGIDCKDSGPLNIGATRNEDPALWFGDAVEILLETDKRSYYQLAVNPAGAMADIDRAVGKGGFQWASQAEVAVATNNAGWTVEIRIPVTRDENDPHHQVIGTKPTAAKPWHFNLCRQRMRDKDIERSAFSPTGQKVFHNARKFGKLYVP